MSFLIIANILRSDDQIIRNQTNQPELRQNLIYQKLRNTYPIFLIHQNNLVLDDLTSVHDKTYLQFLKKCYESWKKDGEDEDYLNSENLGLVPYHFHRRKEFQSILKLPYWKRMGYHADDILTPFHENTFSIALDSANNGLQATKEIDNFDLIYCLNTFPGHHAMTDGYGGYCFLNNLGLVADKLIKIHKAQKVAILDLDYHHGNGTQEIFYDRKDVLTISIHADPKIDYPSYSGFEDENTLTNLNYPLPQGTDWIKYSKTLKIALNQIKFYHPDYLLIAFGGDTFKNDPDASKIGGFNLELEDYYQMGQLIRKKFNGKIIITQEGGYNMDQIADIVDNFIKGLLSNYNHR